jgi:2-polyprenyl-3-methyl-5-hydroxy-6-metoxy-1,4-benzoquinol methylase
MVKHSYQQYYTHVRQEIDHLLPARVNCMLEIGCGHGDTAAWIRSSRGASQVLGIEIDAAAAACAAGKIDEVICGNFETLDLPDHFREFDLILCLDVLEHLVDPWHAIQRISHMLAPGGTLIISIPNVRYFRVVWSLLARGRWEYEEDGILDRTHLRFFTRRSALELVRGGGLDITAVSATGLEPGRKTRYLDALTLSLLRPFFEYQYLIKAQKSSS